MTGIYELYLTDEEREKSGFWYDVTDTCKILLARAGGSNIRFLKAVQDKTQPHRHKLDDLDKMDPGLANKLMIEAFAESVVLDWTGVTDVKGKEIKFSKKHAINLLTELHDLFDELRDAASKQSNYRASVITGDIKN